MDHRGLFKPKPNQKQPKNQPQKKFAKQQQNPLPLQPQQTVPLNTQPQPQPVQQPMQQLAPQQPLQQPIIRQQMQQIRRQRSIPITRSSGTSTYHSYAKYRSSKKSKSLPYKKWIRRRLAKGKAPSSNFMRRMEYFEKNARKMTRNQLLNKLSYHTFTVMTPNFFIENDEFDVQVLRPNPDYDPNQMNEDEPETPFLTRTDTVSIANHYPIDLFANNVVGGMYNVFNESTVEISSLETTIDLRLKTTGVHLSDFAISIIALPNPQHMTPTEEFNADPAAYNTDNTRITSENQYIEIQKRIRRLMKSVASTNSYASAITPTNINDIDWKEYNATLGQAFPIAHWNYLDNLKLIEKHYGSVNVPSSGFITKKLSFKTPKGEHLKITKGNSIYAILTFYSSSIFENPIAQISSRTTIGFIEY